MRYILLGFLFFMSLGICSSLATISACRNAERQVDNYRKQNINIIRLIKQQNTYLKSAVKEKRVVVYTCGDKFDIMGIEGKDVFIVPKK